MTREEAINILSRPKTMKNTPNDILEAHDMAIKALEHPEKNVIAVVPCGDAISRQAVLEIQAKYAEYMGAKKFWQMRDDIKILQSVTPLPKIGRWIKHDIIDGGVYYDCSLCACIAPFTETVDAILWKLANYCPDCGAKMIEPHWEVMKYE